MTFEKKNLYNNTHWLKSYLENKMMLWYVCNFIYETSFGQMIILIEAKQKKTLCCLKID